MKLEAENKNNFSDKYQNIMFEFVVGVFVEVKVRCDLKALRHCDCSGRCCSEAAQNLGFNVLNVVLKILHKCWPKMLGIKNRISKVN